MRHTDTRPLPGRHSQNAIHECEHHVTPVNNARSRISIALPTIQISRGPVSRKHKIFPSLRQPTIMPEAPCAWCPPLALTQKITPIMANNADTKTRSCRPQSGPSGLFIASQNREGNLNNTLTRRTAPQLLLTVRRGRTENPSLMLASRTSYAVESHAKERSSCTLLDSLSITSPLKECTLSLRIVATNSATTHGEPTVLHGQPTPYPKILQDAMWPEIVSPIVYAPNQLTIPEDVVLRDKGRKNSFASFMAPSR